MAACSRKGFVGSRVWLSLGGPLVERTSGYLMRVKMRDATATAAVEGFSAALNRMPLAVRKSMTYDQNPEMAKRAEITQNTGVADLLLRPA